MSGAQRAPAPGTVTRACPCGGLITADPKAPMGALVMHNRSPRHEAWRLGYRIVALSDGYLATDGRPAFRLEER